MDQVLLETFMLDSDEEEYDLVRDEDVGIQRIKRHLPRPHEPNTRPLLIGCSGGGGHNAAINALSNGYAQEHLKEYFSAQLKPEMALSFFMGSLLNKFTKLQEMAHQFNVPDIPPLMKLIPAMKELFKTEGRYYVDMLLDVYPAGFESAAVWNILQREDKCEELAKLITLQSYNDSSNYNVVKKYFLELLIAAHAERQPYTEIVSTQAQGLPALCDAVKEYNELVNANIVIHQYMTDLPTTGAVHFFNPLSNLLPDQQAQIKLYAVNLTQTVINEFFKEGHYFLSVETVDPKNNPMIREGFYLESKDNSQKFSLPVALELDNKPFITINADEKIASIMLGSQAGNDTVEYIRTLIERGTEKIFIFGGSNPEINKKVNQLEEELKNKVVLLDNIKDHGFIASLMTRSNILITRAGGLSVMEQLAMNHNPEQIIFIHHANTDLDELCSGIAWEDANADLLIKALKGQLKAIEKTCPSRIETTLDELLPENPFRQKQMKEWCESTTAIIDNYFTGGFR